MALVLRVGIIRDQMRQTGNAYTILAIIQLKSSRWPDHAQLVIAISDQMLLMPLKTVFKTIATPHKMKSTGAMALAHHALTTLTQVNISTKLVGKVSASPILATTQPKFFWRTAPAQHAMILSTQITKPLFASLIPVPPLRFWSRTVNASDVKASREQMKLAEYVGLIFATS